MSSRRSDERIAKLEQQVDSLKAVVRELADCLQDELTQFDHKLAVLETTQQDTQKQQSAQGKQIKRQEERLRRGLQVMADALASLEK